MRIMITGGGTGGHTSPAVAIVEEMKQRDPRLSVQWIGCRGAIEERIAKSLGIPFRSLPVEGWPRTRQWRRPWVALKLILSGLRAALYVWKFRPQVVVGVGGYVSLPLGWVAQRLGVPVVIHEQNRHCGLANRLLAPKATLVFCSFEDSTPPCPRERVRVVGNPIRRAFANPPMQREARTTMKLRDSQPVVLICGGSQGARSINESVAELLTAQRLEQVQLIWMTGNHFYREADRAISESGVTVKLFRFIDDMVSAMAAADLIVARAGASTAAEIAMMGRASILIPYPHATDNHQEKNAQSFEEAGAAIVLPDEACTGEVLAENINELLADTAGLDKMRDAAQKRAKPLAAERIVEAIFPMVFEEENARK
jgi:UDP-N-acetylglucosamine--N-acetylmuramyl-(pentapeptide) pyrophosphoryl-undecaprenol N-acetylglucosamine transferase